MENFFGFESFGGDVAALFDFQRAFASSWPANACAEENDARERCNFLGEIADLRLKCESLPDKFGDSLDCSRVEAGRQKLFALGDAQNHERESGERCGVTFRIGE